MTTGMFDPGYPCPAFCGIVSESRTDHRTSSPSPQHPTPTHRPSSICTYTMRVLRRPTLFSPLSRQLQQLQQARRAFHPHVLPSLLSTAAPEFQEKSRAMDTLVEDLQRRLADARGGGGQKALDRMRSKGKLTPRERYVLSILLLSPHWTLVDFVCFFP
jgi:hypothetical protein